MFEETLKKEELQYLHFNDLLTFAIPMLQVTKQVIIVIIINSTSYL